MPLNAILNEKYRKYESHDSVDLTWNESYSLITFPFLTNIFDDFVKRLSPRVTKSPHAVAKTQGNNLATVEHQSENYDCWTTSHHNDSNNPTVKQLAQDWNEDRLLEGVNTIT